MIFDKLENAALYRGISARLDRAIDCMLSTDFAAVAVGRYEVDGDDVYYMVQEPALKPREDTKWEVHRRYIDIQLGLSGGEIMGYAPMDSIGGWEDYNGDKDIQLSFAKEAGTPLALERGMFAILFAQDAHRPCERGAQAQTGRKVVFKVRI